MARVAEKVRSAFGKATDGHTVSPCRRLKAVISRQ